MKAMPRDYMPHLLIIVMMAATSIAISLTGDVAISEEDVIGRSLPDRIGDYEGVNVLFCQNESCLKSYNEQDQDLNDNSLCPACGGRLMPASLAEISAFPADTTLARRIYTAPEGDQFSVTAVVSGQDRTGIHRPQYCLPAQGWDILDHRVSSVPITNNQTIDVNILDLQETSKDKDSRNRRSPSSYAYFYVGRHTTPSYLNMIFWISYDRLFNGTSTPWTYISIATDRHDNSDEHTKRIVAFTSLLCQAMDIHPDNAVQSKSSDH